VPDVQVIELPGPVAAHVPSPRQNVELDADVPLFKLFTGRLPVISALARLIGLEES